MAHRLTHEQEYRGLDAIAKIADLRLVVCGCGSVGSTLVWNLARQGFATIRVIDSDRVEEANIGTQVYGRKENGLQKATALANIIFRDVGVSIDAQPAKLEERNRAQLLRDAACIVDCFDNHEARRLVHEFANERQIFCLHVGTEADYAEVTWGEKYKVPQDHGGDAPCDIPLARNLILLAAAVASECLVEFAMDGTRRSYHITLRDRKISLAR